MGVGAPSGVDGKWSEGLFRSLQDRDRSATVRGEQLDPVARQTNVSIARLTACRDGAGRRGYGLERTRNDDRHDEIAGLESKVGEITMDNEPLDAKSRRWRANALWPTGGRDNAPDAAIVYSAFPVARHFSRTAYLL
jgi:hypothetical protein